MANKWKEREFLVAAAAAILPMASDLLSKMNQSVVPVAPGADPLAPILPQVSESVAAIAEVGGLVLSAPDMAFISAMVYVIFRSLVKVAEAFRR